MRITILGAGCIGGLIGAALQASGRAVNFVDRGKQLHALQSSGLCILRGEDELRTGPLDAVADTSRLGVQDVVFLGLKAHQIAAALPQLLPLLGPDTALVPLQNGLPWWYFQRHGGEFEGRVIESCDPGGVLSRAIDPGRIVGCIAYPAAARVAPGVIRHVEGERFPVGSPDGAGTEVVTEVSRLLQGAGFKSPVLNDIRAEIWLKAIGNMSLNPVSALTHATLVEICEHPGSRALVRQMMEEGEAVAARLGVSLRVPVEKRLEGARRVGPHRSSMLQDVESGEPLECEALVGAVSELGLLTGVPTPSIDNVLALARLLNRVIISEQAAIVRRTRSRD